MASKKANAKAVSRKPAAKAKAPVKKAAHAAKAKVLVKKAAPAAKVKAPAKKTAPPPKVAKAPAPAPDTLQLKSFTPSLTVNDLAASITFYTDGLGFAVGQRWADGDVLRGVMLKSGELEFGISQDDWKMGKDRKKGQGFRVFCGTDQDLDAIAARLKTAGFSLTAEPSDQPAWGVRSFSVDDPDGFHLTLTRKL